jgi:acyl-CoA dehydrogenase
VTTVDQTGFFQEAPSLHDEWHGDHALRSYLRRVLPAEVLAEIRPSLAEMGRLTANELYELHCAMDRRGNEPRLNRFDPWGRRIDRIETSPAWEAIARFAATHGVVATGYERAHAEHSRVHQFALAYLYAPSSALYGCPLAMTDGAARTLERHRTDHEAFDEAFRHLTSRDPAEMWTSGQWMTERTGGSDVGVSETTATKDGEVWRLSGTKWFTSAITADVTLTLARPEGNPPGGRGLAMFFLKVRDENGALNGIRVLRLKDKLGTRQMPTAELALDGTAAHLVGEPRNGTKNITPMLHVTRIWNSITAASGMRRGLALARDYAEKRVAFGDAIAGQPLHQATLAQLRVEHEAAMQLAFRAVELLGLEEAGGATDADLATFRLVTPIAKLVTGKQAVAGASEALEAFGGAGYIEDTHLPVLLRDAQVLPIWEGTTNVLSLDVLRGIQREDALRPYLDDIRQHAEATEHPALAAIGRQAIDAGEHAAAWLGEAASVGGDAERAGGAGGGMAAVQHGARSFAFTLGRAMQAALLARQAQHDLDVLEDGRALAVARRFASFGVDLLEEPGAFLHDDAALARDEPLEV